MQLLTRASDETAKKMYDYFKDMIAFNKAGKMRFSPYLLEYAESYCEAYERELKRIDESDYPRIKD